MKPSAIIVACLLLFCVLRVNSALDEWHVEQRQCFAKMEKAADFDRTMDFTLLTPFERVAAMKESLSMRVEAERDLIAVLERKPYLPLSPDEASTLSQSKKTVEGVEAREKQRQKEEIERARKALENANANDFRPPVAKPYVETNGVVTRIGENTYIGLPTPAAPRATPTAADVQAEILRKYGPR